MSLQDGFKTGEVVAATGVASDTLQGWLRRGLVFDQDKIEGGGKQGRHRRYTFFTVMQIAVARALMQAGMTNPRAAFAAAAVFAHTGRSMPRLRRLPGMPFPTEEGATFLATAGEQTVLWADLGPHEPVIRNLVAALRRPTGFIVCDVSLVFERTVYALGEDPVLLVREAYQQVRYPESGFVEVEPKGSEAKKAG